MKKSIIAFVFAGASLLSGCEKDDVQMQVTASESNTARARQLYALNAETSVAEWKGAGPGVSHEGSFAVTSQEIEVVNNKIKGGYFKIPIASIQNFDLPDEVKPVLLEHLKSPDFFNMLVYPEAVFIIKRVTPLNKKVEGAVTGAGSLVTGNFTMLGTTHEVSFPARISFEGNKLTVEATFKLDRTRWGMSYAADPALGDHHIYPEVAIHLKLFGYKK